MKVDVYRNLHKKCWSIRSVVTGRVVAHKSDATVANAKFIVQPAGRAKVLREKKKNVHAFVRGEWIETGLYIVDDVTVANVKLSLPNPYLRIEVSYNPYKMGYFYKTATEESVIDSSLVALTSQGKVYMVGV